jgi:hypothetical protein
LVETTKDVMIDFGCSPVPAEAAALALVPVDDDDEKYPPNHVEEDLVGWTL